MEFHEKSLVTTIQDISDMENVNRRTIKSQIKSHQILIGSYLLNNRLFADRLFPYLICMRNRSHAQDLSI